MSRTVFVASARRRAASRRRDGAAVATWFTGFRVFSTAFLLVSLVLLSMTRSSSDGCLHGVHGLPRAWNTRPPREAPLVRIDLQRVSHNGTVLGNTAEIAAGAKAALDELEATLRSSRQLCRMLGGECRDVVAFEVDRRVESGVLKRVLASTLRAGYSQHDFLVERWVAMALPDFAK